MEFLTVWGWEPWFPCEGDNKLPSYFTHNLLTTENMAPQTLSSPSPSFQLLRELLGDISGDLTGSLWEVEMKTLGGGSDYKVHCVQV